MDSIKLERTVFKMKQGAMDTESGSASGVSLRDQCQYIQFRVKDYKKGSERLKLLQIIDVTSYILYTEFKAKN
jgi:hypothetical protein